MEELIYLKNKINISSKEASKKKEKKYKEKNIEGDKLKSFIESKEETNEVKKGNKNYNILEIKTEKLIFYKNLITNIEVIYDNMQILRKKGNNLPINIQIIIQYDKKNEADYYLEQKKSSFEQIEIFLLNAKNDYIEKLDSYYKAKKHLRYLHGKLFVNMADYLVNGNLDKIIDILITRMKYSPSCII